MDLLISVGILFRCESIMDNQSNVYEFWSCSSCTKNGELSISKYTSYCISTREHKRVFAKTLLISEKKITNFHRHDYYDPNPPEKTQCGTKRFLEELQNRSFKP